MTTITRRTFLAAAFTLAATAGCGGPKDQPETGEVHGKVTLDGKPLPGATVTFQPSPGRPSSGITQFDGTYRLEYNADTPGAKVGQHKVYISTFVPPQINDDTKKVIKPGFPEKVPKQYNENTSLNADVKGGDNTIDFDLKSR